MELHQCHALLTGASGGIGFALADQLASAGAHLLLVARQTEKLEPLTQRFPGQVQLVRADLTQASGRRDVADAASRFVGFNCLINAAGINQFRLLAQQDEDAIAEMMNLNVTAALQLTHRLLPQLQENDNALVVNVGSTFGSIGYPGFAAYCASKFALRGFSEALRRELADSGVRVLYVAPRATRTGMNGRSVVAMNEQLRVAMDAPHQVARRILTAIQRERDELYIGWPEKLFVRINSLFPQLVSQSLHKQLPIIQRYARHDS
ncbi:short chain dehydrogenase [Isoalcanivorax pacificus W11-5]|jgi:short-subunit dehydrogenase|uniref:Short chain dehydrogenase n=1 Tax=Isoalcanivorax pacificus W11-5 TaxID=391936 RepID=A0A0B4XMW3_9GAMM|nr:SDR family oxidoreductase [Isoalcanivorax pacificus]AJD48000.1 short chain dehydrogenase [Isoalcanivorax pacificus W11-5]